MLLDHHATVQFWINFEIYSTKTEKRICAHLLDENSFQMNQLIINTTETCRAVLQWLKNLVTRFKTFPAVECMYRSPSKTEKELKFEKN